MEQRQPDTQGSAWSSRRANANDRKTEVGELCEWTEWSCVRETRETTYTESNGSVWQRRTDKTEWSKTSRWTRGAEGGDSSHGGWHNIRPQLHSSRFAGGARQQGGASSPDGWTTWPPWVDRSFDRGRESSSRREEEAPEEASQQEPRRAEANVGEALPPEASRVEKALALLGGPLPLNGRYGAAVACGTWEYVIRDEQRRCFAGLLRGAVGKPEAAEWFDRVRGSVRWQQQQGDWGPTPRKTAWTVRPECRCSYRYSGIKVDAQPWPDWMDDLLSIIMPLCGAQNKADWPNSCNLNLYEDGWKFLAWHRDDEHLFQGAHRDCAIVSLSLGQPRVFEMYAPAPAPDAEETTCQVLLGDGDVCTMEGLFQKHYMHRAPYESGDLGPRINLTWRWIVAHEQQCPLHEPPSLWADAEGS